VSTAGKLPEVAVSAPADGPRAPLHGAADDEASLLRGIIDRLPLGVTVQDAQGRFLVVNQLAATALAMTADDLIGRSPADLLPEPEAASRREWELGILQGGQVITAEEAVPGPDGERIWRVAHAPARVGEQVVLISSSMDITEFKQAERELGESAHIDKLTGLPDRVRVQRHVEAVIRSDDGNLRFALAFIDLDNFKHINDYYSHAIGDALLVKMGERLTKSLGTGDMLARIGGDQFILMLAHAGSEEQIKAIVDEKLNSIRHPFHIEAFEVFGSCSIGISVYPDHGRSYETLRRNADSAMYKAKNDSKGRAVVFNAEMGKAAATRMEAEQRLRLAIRDRKFCCAFQPKVDIKTHDVVGFEALVRWRDENGEIHPPGGFVGLAIELGLINPVAHFVLEESLASIDRLDEAFGPNTSISINIAARQASDQEFMTSVAATLRDSGRAERFIIELTEEAFLAKGKFQTLILPMFREIGVRVSIDDFGTGYSSLSALADIVADEIKIDRSFITAIHERPRNQSVLRAIESLAHALGMTIVAEGVETHEELAYLDAATRIHLAQGYYFSKPIYLDDPRLTRGHDRDSRPHVANRSFANPRAVASTRE
jgi:diguanylate cyclase (GGDEF)-like protein/PAS domain S-box-containing protein